MIKPLKVFNGQSDKLHVLCSPSSVGGHCTAGTAIHCSPAGSLNQFHTSSLPVSPAATGAPSAGSSGDRKTKRELPSCWTCRLLFSNSSVLSFLWSPYLLRPRPCKANPSSHCSSWFLLQHIRESHQIQLELRVVKHGLCFLVGAGQETGGMSRKFHSTCYWNKNKLNGALIFHPN